MGLSGLRLLIGMLTVFGIGSCAEPVNIDTEFTVGPQGGTLTFANGAVVVTFPPGSVPQSTKFTVTSTTTFPEGPTVVPGTVYQVGPADFQFDQPVLLRIRFGDNPLPAGVRKRELGLYRVVSGAWQANSGQTIDSTTNTLNASITSLGTFGILGAPAASLDITPVSLSLTVGGLAPLTANVKDAAARVLPDRAVAWSVLDPSVASVGESGLVAGEQVGTARVVAAAGPVADTVVATVSATASTLLPACSTYAAPAVPGPSRTFYINASTGNDAANGLTKQTAWKTLDKANTIAQAGDLFLLSGTFRSQWIRPVSDGTPGQKIVFRRAPGAVATLDSGLYETTADLSNRSNIVMDGLEIMHVDEPFRLYNSQSNWMRNLYIHDASGSNLRAGSSDNRVEDSQFLRIGSEQQNTGDAVYLSNGSNRNVIARNSFAYAGHGAIWISHQSTSDVTADDNYIVHNRVVNPWANGIGLNLTANRTTMECNIIASTANGTGANYKRFGMEVEGTDNTVRYNLIFTTGDGGISLEAWTFNGKTAHATGNMIYNNTVWSTGGASLRIVQKDNSVVDNNVVENNIFWSNAGALDNGSRYSILADEYNIIGSNYWPDGTIGNNVVRNNSFENNINFMLITRTGAAGTNIAYTMAGAQSTFAGWQNNLQADPLLVNPAGLNFTLGNGSPAVDAGVAVGPRPVLGTAPDLGALETR